MEGGHHQFRYGNGVIDSGTRLASEALAVPKNGDFETFGNNEYSKSVETDPKEDGGGGWFDSFSGSGDPRPVTSTRSAQALPDNSVGTAPP